MGRYSFTDTTLNAEWKLFIMHKPLRDSAASAKSPAEWWCGLKPMLPKLFEVARAVLCIAATSTPVECMWDKTKRVFSKQRGRLHPETGAKQAFLHDIYRWLSGGGEALLRKYEARAAAQGAQ
jgi:hypothetical protein